MNLIWNKNIALFKKRFPSLAFQYKNEIEHFHLTNVTCNSGFELLDAKSGAKTLRQNGVPLHSLYDPAKEALKAAESFLAAYSASHQVTEVVFLGFGLGYLPAAIASSLRETQISFVLVEPDVMRLFLAFFFVDFESVFLQPNCSVLTGAPPEVVLNVLERNGILQSHFFSFESNQAHAKEYFAAVNELIERNKHKERINKRTAQKFAALWQKNNKKNLRALRTCSGVKKFFGTDTRPALVVAAGPTLDLQINFIGAAKSKKTHTIICVDTALRTLLRDGIEPDFIVAADAQYWNYCHLNGLASPSSVLIAEVSSYPPVMRFNCKEIAVFDSAHPEKKDVFDWAAEKGTLGAGGTVASSAWDFARMLGATKIVLAGMDLSFPQKLTHARGSLFEERAHSNASKICSAETQSAGALFSAPSSYVKDYAGNTVLSDVRMDLYAWWFESHSEKYPNVKTFALSAQSRKIPGIELAS